MKPAGKQEQPGKVRFTLTSTVVITLILALILVFLVFFSNQGLQHIYRLRQEKICLETKNQELAEENTRLVRTIDRLQNDPEMIQDLIRRELNFVKKNELIIQLAPEEKDKPVKAALIPDRPPGAASHGPEKPKPRGRHP